MSVKYYLSPYLSPPAVAVDLGSMKFYYERMQVLPEKAVALDKLKKMNFIRV